MKIFTSIALALAITCFAAHSCANTAPDKTFLAPIAEKLLAGEVTHASLSPDGKHIVVLLQGAGVLINTVIKQRFFCNFEG